MIWYTRFKVKCCIILKYTKNTWFRWSDLLAFGSNMIGGYHVGGNRFLNTHRDMKNMILNTLFGISGHYVLYHIYIRHSGSLWNFVYRIYTPETQIHNWYIYIYMCMCTAYTYILYNSKYGWWVQTRISILRKFHVGHVAKYTMII